MVVCKSRALQFSEKKGTGFTCCLRSIEMKSSKRGENILVSVENITPFGIWLFVKGREYFLSYKDYPYFREQTLKSVQAVQLLHSYHLYWPQLDVDLEIDNLENPEKYPLKSKMTKSHLTSQSSRSRASR
jgi:hypothetical protein